jgi:hypothetical protein
VGPENDPDALGKLKITRQFVAWINPKTWDQFQLGQFFLLVVGSMTSEAWLLLWISLLPDTEFGGPKGL